MSQQHDDDDGTVIRPKAPNAAVAPGASASGPGSGPSPSQSAEDGLSLRIGARVGEFEITQRIGEGGFSIVYLAMDRSLERTVALKEYMPMSLATRVGTTLVQPRSQRYRDTFEAGLKSFVNEAKLLAQFDHPSLVKVYRFWEDNGTAYMVMPFYQGVTVKDAIRAMPEPPDEAWLMALLAPLTEALLVIHAERCYHRDIAPDNVILLASSAKPLLLDFGAARRVIGDMTQALTVILKAGYAPVEQYAEIPGMKQGAWTDVYALAAVVYWAITGKTPPASVGRMLSDSFVPLARCATDRYSLRFLQAIDRALAVLPEQRTQSIDALRQELGLAGEGGIGPTPLMDWSGSDATVIRPARAGSQPTNQNTRGSTAAPGLSPTTGAPTHGPTPSPPLEATKEPGSFPVREERPRATTVKQGSLEGGPARARTPRRAMLIASTAGAAMVAAAVWWAVQQPSAEPSAPVREGAGPVLETREPVATPRATELPAVAAPAAAVQPISPSPAASAEVPAAAVETSPVPAVAPLPVDPVPATPPIKSMPDPPPVRAARKPAPTEKAAAQPDQKTERASQRTEARDSERAPVDSASRAECGRIFQRLSLGESSPELLNRLKTLKCQ